MYLVKYKNYDLFNYITLKKTHENNMFILKILYIKFTIS